MHRIMQGLEQLSSWGHAFRSEAPPVLHQEAEMLITLADNMRYYSENLAHEQALYWHGVESAIRFAAEYLYRAEHDTLALPQEGRHAS